MSLVVVSFKESNYLPRDISDCVLKFFEANSGGLSMTQKYLQKLDILLKSVIVSDTPEKDLKSNRGCLKCDTFLLAQYDFEADPILMEHYPMEVCGEFRKMNEEDDLFFDVFDFIFLKRKTYGLILKPYRSSRSF
ncbi:hypothetical protein RF11_06531 [Thelohanellus kitauei]|uniref:Uncharacterized protein n=1 Tax=Thelohanellus kitauei TaxID=669202 RepID=A0A0C2JCW7_THEKT|nr:hypothetical protein RF11_06531 [Thelohanellus kitauei]